MKWKTRLAGGTWLIWVLSGCAPGAELWVPRDADLSPPVLLDCVRDAQGRIVLTFDEPAANLEVAFPETGGSLEAGEGTVRTLTLHEMPKPGEEWVLSAMVSDSFGNTATFLFSIFGVNPRLADVRLNEVSIQGSSAHPDYVELKVLKAGDLAGLTLALGSPESGEPFYVFPPCEVAAGDYVLLHAKPSGLPTEINERNSKWESGGLDAGAGAWDFWWRGGEGLSGTTGGVAVMDSPRGRVLDGLLYSNRTSASDEKYGGWGSGLNQERAEWLVTEGGWPAVEGEVIPEHAASSAGVTSTRTLNRRASGEGAEAWFIGATGTYSPGAANTSSAHSP